MSTEEKPQRLSPHLRRLLILKLWLIEKFRFGERQVTLVWAAVIGILGALVTECFRRATDLLHFLFTGSEATIITSFERLPLWHRRERSPICSICFGVMDVTLPARRSCNDVTGWNRSSILFPASKLAVTSRIVESIFIA